MTHLLHSPVKVALVALTLAMFSLTGCGPTEPATVQGRQNLQDGGRVALNEFRATDQSLDELLNKSYGYVIFPSVAKGGLIIGGAHGQGVVYEQGAFAGYAELQQAQVGFLAGGQEFQELLVFATREPMDRFKAGKLTFGAEASAVALKAGAAATARFADGLAVFVKPKGGLMFDISLAGQKFEYKRSEDATR
jgi:lipid-binding SYLF domain-containing protein